MNQAAENLIAVSRAHLTGVDVKERPILFSGAMVRALLDGSKSQTRRVVKPMRGFQSQWLTAETINSSPRLYTCYAHEGSFGAQMEHPKGGPLGWVGCPYGETGDRLWVRETFCLESNRMTDDDAGPPHNDGRPVKRFGDDDFYWSQPHYKASDPEPELWYEDMDGPGCRWTPSIHMPRWVSRITLEITAVRVERLRDISVEDAEAEGCKAPLERVMQMGCAASPSLYRELWDSLNAARGYGWDVNPWVWVVEFKSLREC
jgi:hypothetical protein